MNTHPPSSPLSVMEIRKMIQRMRGAQIAASVNDDVQWGILRDAIHALQELHKIKTGQQY